MLHSKMTKMDYVIEAVLIVIGAIVCICILYPILNILAISISADGPVLRHDVRLIPQGFTLKAYKDILKNESILRAFGNSIFITGVGVVCSLAATYLAAYPIACCEFPGKKIYNVFVLIPMWFQGGMVPSYLCVQKLGLINSYWALILTALISSYHVLILTSFLRGIPRELLESARMDGAGEFRVMLQVVAPLAKASFATIGLWVIAGHWNAYFGPLLYIRTLYATAGTEGNRTGSKCGADGSRNSERRTGFCQYRRSDPVRCFDRFYDTDDGYLSIRPEIFCKRCYAGRSQRINTQFSMTGG